jgi:LuxR family maltose regulon positive regulatory protein
MRDDMERTILLAHQALAALSPTDVRLRGEVMVRLGVAQAWQGEVAEAAQAYAEAKWLGFAANDLHTALRAMSLTNWMRRWIISSRRCATARGLLRIRVDCHILMALVLQAHGDLIAAQHAIGQAERLIELFRLPQRYRGFALRTEMLVCLAAGDLSPMAGWADSREPAVWEELDFPYEEERMALADLSIARGRYEEAIALLVRLHSFAEAQGRFHRALLMLVAKAKALYLLGEREQASATLERGLMLGAPSGYVRAFIDQGETIHTLVGELHVALSRRAGEREHDALLAYLEKLLAVFLPKKIEPRPITPSPRHLAGASQADLLSEREVEVLQKVATGASNQEIAEQLIVSLNTVKRHVKNIFNKLGVNSRTQAVRRAQESGLI